MVSVVGSLAMTGVLPSSANGLSSHRGSRDIIVYMCTHPDNSEDVVCVMGYSCRTAWLAHVSNGPVWSCVNG